MKTIYNHTYKIHFKSGVKFDFKRTYPHLSYEGYKKPIYRQLPYIIKTLIDDPKSRRAVIVVNHKNEEPNACLLSIQFLIDVNENKMIVIANFRSQCEYFGRPNDEKLILSVIDYVQDRIGYYDKTEIFCNVANYHRRDDLIELYGKSCSKVKLN